MVTTYEGVYELRLRPSDDGRIIPPVVVTAPKHSDL